jgi:hypothetical protein
MIMIQDVKLLGAFTHLKILQKVSPPFILLSSYASFIQVILIFVLDDKARILRVLEKVKKIKH